MCDKHRRTTIVPILLLVSILPMGLASSGCRSNSTTPASKATPQPQSKPSAVSAPFAAHDGVLITSLDGQLIVEYVVNLPAHTMRIYTLEKDGQPLSLSVPPRVTLRGVDGPEEIVLADCADAAYPSACAQASYPRQISGSPVGVIRIEHSERSHRLALPAVVRKP